MHKVKTLPRKKNVYDNCVMLDSAGGIVTRVSKTKMNFYIRKNLAIQVDENQFQLNFSPKGRSNDDSFLSSFKENRCVVCGTKERLTGHHVVPYSYRKHFPIYLKSHNVYDILPACTECHDNYEVFAYQYKVALQNKYAPITPICQKAIRLSKTILSKENKLKYKRGIQIPDEVIPTLIEKVGNLLGMKTIPTIEDIERIADTPTTKTSAKHVVAVMRLNKLSEFIIHWRKHFIEHAQPKFLNEAWDINQTIEDHIQKISLPIIQ